MSALAAAAPAVADGDPASDVLLAQQLFLPPDSAADPQLAAELTDALGSANRAGYEIRVAIIASSTDLGAIPSLWKKPKTYARFLGEELRQVYTGRLLIVMPNGFGFFDADGESPTDTRVVAATGPPGTNGLLRAALDAVRGLQAANGVTAHSSSGGGSPILGWIAIAAGGCLAATAAALLVLRRRR
jgi:hypothetical protein